MAVQATEKNRTAPSSSLTALVVRLLLLFAIDTAATWLIFNLVVDGVYVLAVTIGLITLGVNIVILAKDLYPLRWMVVGLVFMMLFSIYPILFNIYVAFTNYGDGHLFNKEQVISQIEKVSFVPEGSPTYTWTPFKAKDSDDFILWLQRPGEPGLLAKPDEALVTVTPGAQGIGELDSKGIPISIEGYDRLNPITASTYQEKLTSILFGAEPETVSVISSSTAALRQPRYKYDSVKDVVVDQLNGDVYEPKLGTFTGPQGLTLTPGFSATIGFENFRRFFSSPALRGPLTRIVTWNFAFAFLSVFLTFALGLFIAYIYNDPQFPGRKLIQSLLLIPYTIPSLITILVWRGVLNPEIGIVNQTLQAWFGISPPWFTDQWWAKAGVLLVNLWLGYPYFMLICSGALQAIPKDIYEAAEIDGANGWQRFRRITLPLLLVAVGPLLVASFTYNFNNFNIIFLFISGGPPIAGSPTPAGHTDILISYVYNLAFAGGRSVDYGFAAAISIIIFTIVAMITLLQFRYTRMWEKVGENV